MYTLSHILIGTLISPPKSHSVFANELLSSQGFDFSTIEEYQSNQGSVVQVPTIDENDDENAMHPVFNSLFENDLYNSERRR